MAQKKAGKSEKPMKVSRICVLGPSFVGKTQIVNRLVNNNFYPQYHETEEVEKYKIYYNRAQNVSSQPDFISIEIMDTFPQDHPYLFTDPNSNEEAKKMQEQLKHIIENKPIKDDENPNS